MGWFSWALSQTAATTLALAYLKRRGIIEIRPEAVENGQAREVIVKAVQLGEDAIEFVDNYLKQAWKK